MSTHVPSYGFMRYIIIKFEKAPESTKNTEKSGKAQTITKKPEPKTQVIRKLKKHKKNTEKHKNTEIVKNTEIAKNTKTKNTKGRYANRRINNI